MDNQIDLEILCHHFCQYIEDPSKKTKLLLPKNITKNPAFSSKPTPSNLSNPLMQRKIRLCNEVY